MIVKVDPKHTQIYTQGYVTTAELFKGKRLEYRTKNIESVTHMSVYLIMFVCVCVCVCVCICVCV
jgi:hypothetical protein